MAECVLDASALMARLSNEAGAHVVEAASPGLISSVNFAEVVGKLIDRGVSVDVAADAARDAGVSVVPFEETTALEAGLLRAPTRRLGLSLADRACLALAKELGLPVLTADRAWAELDLDVEVVLIR